MKKKCENLVFRRNLESGDEKKISDIVSSTGFFSDEEVAIAVELAEETISTGIKSGYEFIFGELDNCTAGYCCFGRIPGTKSSYDLYWIAVHCGFQSMGIGAALMKEVEKTLISAGGRKVFIETSSKIQYEPTRRFYINSEYVQEAILYDFYDQGDHKIIYSKIIR
jgi:D-alanine-D-alanine ligase